MYGVSLFRNVNNSETARTTRLDDLYSYTLLRHLSDDIIHFCKTSA